MPSIQGGIYTKSVLFSFKSDFLLYKTNLKYFKEKFYLGGK